MEATTVDQAVEALLAPSEPAEEVVTEQESNETEAQLDETEAESSEVEQGYDEGEEDSESEAEAELEEQEYEAEDEQEADQSGPDTFVVKVDGEQVEVTLDDLKRDYSGQAYIQKGMREAAEAKKQAEQAYAQLGEQQQQLQALMQNLQQNGVMAQPTPPSAQMAQDDPLGYMEAKAKYDEDLIAFQTQRREIAQQQHSMQAAQQQAQQGYLQEQMSVLVKAIPEFGDAEKAPKLKESLIKQGTKLGYTPEEIGAVTDSRAMIALHKAMLYDQMMASSDKVQTKVKKAKPLMKSGAKKPVNTAAKKKQAQMSKLKKSGSVADAAALLFQG